MSEQAYWFETFMWLVTNKPLMAVTIMTMAIKEGIEKYPVLHAIWVFANE
jgi:hypothetical protein